ncbi:MAG: hypothetical protein JJE04_21495 [Acidobacteriia bacterium]|nr:hypothetical protein [Terriglobia bacterium]
MLISNPKGGYSFLRGISPYSAGAVSSAGFAIEHARFAAPGPLDAGFARVRAHLQKVGRPPQALCGMELRSPKPFTFAGFNQFNSGYVQVLKDWGIFLDGLNPVARTNVAPELTPPSAPSLYGFSYTVPSAAKQKSFVVAGAGELPEGSLDPHDVVRMGQTSEDALREKARFVMGLMTGRINGLGVSWDEVTVTEIYTVHPICTYLAAEILKPMRGGGNHGVTWHYSRPPIESIEYEMDLRGCAREIVLPA